MKQIKFTLLVFHSVLLSGFMTCAHCGDGFSLVEPRREHHHPWSTYANPANNDSRAYSQGIHYRNYGYPPIPRIPPPRRFNNHISFIPNFMAGALILAQTDSTTNPSAPAVTPASEDATSIPNATPPASDEANPSSEAPAASDDEASTPNGVTPAPDESSATMPNAPIPTSDELTPKAPVIKDKGAVQENGDQTNMDYKN